jgi:hypothetical protein
MSQSAIPLLCHVFFDKQFTSGKELMLNIARLLTRVGNDMSCQAQMVHSGHIQDFLKAMVIHKHSSAILIRLAYILGSLTTNFEEARKDLCKMVESKSN